MPRAPKQHSPAKVSAKRHGLRSDRQRQLDRGMRTNSRRWRKIRAAFLREHPLCQECEKSGLVTPAKVVDHVDGNSHNNSPDNFAALCASCHSRKTARQDGGFGNAKA
ncbi:HNH endonuclease [Guyparkeria hydrothermalis]|uniref:HNH endonuclease n=1 Tax=Guyparkeria hydrothermalis TaxID=923 RepID=UPI0020211643|nr:HNH endonuclease signature motif containing protein [Guyparkeria hydrothermalis]MCL7744359.1 HNH endonuclease [Guyparkeria hydrothermalis]